MPSESLEDQLRKSLKPVLDKLRKHRDSEMKKCRDLRIRAQQHHTNATEADRRIRETERAMGIKTWTQRKMAELEERSDVTPKG